MTCAPIQGSAPAHRSDGDPVGGQAGRTADTTVRLARRLAAASSGSPAAAVAAARDLAAAAGEALQEAVDRARAAGTSWREIGELLGTTRQAAFQRFGRPVDPRTGTPMSRDVPPGTTEKAVAILASLAEGRWEDARTDFDARMRGSLDTARLAEAWARTAAIVGRYEGMGEPHARYAGDHVLVEVPLRFEAGEGAGRVVFDAAGKVAGLWLRHAPDHAGARPATPPARPQGPPSSPQDPPDRPQDPPVSPQRRRRTASQARAASPGGDR